MRRERGEPIDHEKVGQRLGQLKKEGISKSQIAGQCGFAPATISRMCEKGQKFDKCTIDEVEKVLKINIRIPKTNTNGNIIENNDNPTPVWIQNSKFIKNLISTEIKSLDIDLSRLKLILMQARDDPNFATYLAKLHKVLRKFTEELDSIKGDVLRGGTEKELYNILANISGLKPDTVSLRSLIIISAYNQSNPSSLFKEGSSTRQTITELEQKNLPQKQSLISKLLRSFRKIWYAMFNVNR